jgi:BlaI family transcriptional regulator, penicillinase repressor
MRSTEATSDALPELTAPELAVMQALWRADVLAAREIHDRVGTEEGWAYTTTRTVVERLVKKGLVRKRLLHGLTVYEPAVSRARGLARRLLDLADRVLQVDRSQVVSFLGRSESLSAQDLKELQAIIGGPAPRRAAAKRRLV